MSLRPARRNRPFGKDHRPSPYQVDGVRDEPARVLVGRVLETRACVKCGYDLLGLPLDGKCSECGTPISKIETPCPAPAKLLRRGVVDADKSCTGCGYNLRGLPVRNVCPECGKPIMDSVLVSRYGHTIVDASDAWLRMLAFGCVLFAIGGIGLLASMILWGAAGGLIGGPATGAAGVVWWIGVVIITRARPPLPGAEVDTRREWVWSRSIARVTQGFWVVRGVVITLGASGTLTGTPLFAWSLAAAVVGGLGLAAVFLYVAHLADWAADDVLQRRARASIVLGPFAVFWGVVSILNGWAGFMIGGPMALWGAGLYSMFILLPMWYLMLTVWAVGQLGPWALANHMHEQARLERMRGRAAEDLAAANAGREHGVVQDTAQPEVVLMPGPASGATGPGSTKAADSIRPGHRRVPPKLSR